MSRERTEHAAEAVRGVIEGWRLGGPAPTVSRTCTRCGRREVLPLEVGVVRVERDHPVGGFTADLALIAAHGVVGYLEFVDDERLSDAKVRRLDAPHLVLSITDVLEDPLHWRPLPSTARTWQCASCLDEVRAAPRPAALPSAAELAATRGIDLPLAPYRTEVVQCFRCRRPTLVHTWEGHRPHGPEVPPEPIPAGLRRIFSAGARDYHWANHCLQCGAAQPDSLLHGHRTGPFFVSDAAYRAARSSDGSPASS